MTNNYRQLKEIILLESYDLCDFPSLKEQFASKINSPRTFERVQSLEKLIKVLESRAVLCEENVSILFDIVDFMPRKGLCLRKAIKNYQLLPRKPKHNGKFTWIFTLVILAGILGKYFDYYYSEESDLKRSLSSRKKELIYDKLCTELGRYWRDFGRNLNVREGKLDEINSEYKSFKDKILKVLEIHEYNMPVEERWFYEITTALERARRKDLSKSLQEFNLLDV